MKPNIKQLFTIFVLITACQSILGEGFYIKSRIKNFHLFAGSLSGTVYEKNGHQALAKASVYIPDLKYGTVADESGHYMFKSLPNGTYVIEAHYVGYKTVAKNVTITGPFVLDFELTDEAVEENAVVVTGLSKATEIKRSPIPIVSVNHEYLVSNLNSNIIDGLTKVPGITAVTTGPNVSKPFIRGLGYNRILTLYDGVRQEGQQWGDEHGIEADQYGIEKAEIIKGPASLTYGSDALAGVVNLIPTPPAQEGKIIGEILGQYQTNNGLYAFSEMLSGTKNGFEWLGRVSHKQASNYQNSIDGRVYGTAYNETDGNITLGLHRNGGYSHLSLSLYDDRQKIPDGSRDSASRKFTKQITEADTVRPIVTDDELKSYPIAGTYQHIQHYRIFSNNNFILGNSRLAINLGYQYSHRREYSHPQELFIPGLNLQLNTYNYDIKFYIPESNGWSFSLGVNGMYQKNRVTNGTKFVIPSYQQFDFGPFALLKKSMGKFDISGGIRFDSRSFSSEQLYTKPNPLTGFDMPVADPTGADYHFSQLSHTYSGLSGSLGGTYNITDKITFKVNLSRGYRAPNIAEISANGVHPGTNIYQIGSAEFSPEFSLQEDVGFIYSSKYAVFNLSVFKNNVSNFIYNQKLLSVSGSDSIIVAGNQTFKFQQGNTSLYGGELNVDIHPIKPIHFENSFSLVYGNIKGSSGHQVADDAKYLPQIPPFHWISELRYDFDKKSSHIVNGFLKAQLVYYAKQDRAYFAYNTETATPGYTQFNLGAGAGFTNPKGKTLFNIYIMGNNLFDVAYQDHLSRLKYFEFYSSSPNGHLGIYNMGRNIAFKIIFPLDFEYN